MQFIYRFGGRTGGKGREGKGKLYKKEKRGAGKNLQIEKN